MFGNLKKDGLEESTDRVGGREVMESGIYTGTIKGFYGGESEKGAQFVNVTFTKEDGKDYSETVYVTNQKGENFYAVKDKDGKPTGKNAPLPGFTIIDDICACVTGAPLCEQNWEEKIAQVWDKDAGKELPKAVQSAVDVVGGTVSLGILKVLENKGVKNEATNRYEPTAEEVEKNGIDKVWNTEARMTVAEARDGVTEQGVYWAKWEKLNVGEGKFKDGRKFKAGAGGKAGAPAAGKPGAPAAGGTAKILFGKKA